MKLLIGFLVSTLGLAGQTVTSAVRIGGQSHADSTAGTAIVGFISGPGPSELRAILGVFGAARIGPPLAVPDGVTRVYLSPRQRYGLVEGNADGPLAVWGLGEEAAVPITGAFPHPDLVAFSPKGESAALYSSAAKQVQVISGIPGKVVLKEAALLESPGAITMMALSDDAGVAITKDSAGELRVWSSQDKSWRPFYGGYSPLAWSFIPKTHDLVISDSQANAVLLIEQAERSSTPIVLAETCRPDQLAVTSDGRTLVALEFKPSNLWTIELKSRTRTAIPSTQSLDSLTVLRNGATFLASSLDPDPTLLKISDAGGTQMTLVHAGTVPGSR
jgi:hypothetical protein